MKKLVLIGAVLCAAVAAQAASVKWNSTAKIADAKGTALTSQAGYEALLNGGSIVLAILNDGSYNGNYNVLGGTVKFNTSPKKKAGKLTGSYEFAFSAGALKNGDVLGVLFKDAKGNLSQLIYTAGGTVDDILTISGMTDNLFSADFSYAASGNFTVVPEPTSGLMILLGLAGLALRRKQA